MADNMDTRIIQMKFENREFERNIAQSTKSVEELKEAMDFEETSRGLEKFAEGTKVLGFDALANNVEKLMNKFTGLGTVSEYVLSRLRSYVEGAAQSVEYFIRSLTTSQISVGEYKYDALNKAVMTIISGGQATEEEAYSIMERVATYTDQTSHNFETMVSRISDLTSRGMGLNEAERLVEAMGNAATYAGQDATNAAMSMGVLSKAMAGQYLGYEQYLQLANTSKVITTKWKEQALEAAEAVGTLKRKNDKLYVNVKGQKAVEVSVQNLETTLRQRWLTNEVLQEIYKNYMFGDTEDELAHPEDAIDSFGKTAYLTGQRALTLKDALNAIRESVSSGWMQSFRLIFGDVTEAAEHFTNICNRVIESLEHIKEFRNGILESWSREGGRSSLMRILFGDYEEDVQNGVVGFMDLLDGLGKIIFDGFVDFLGLFAGPTYRSLMKKDPAFLKAYLGQMIVNMTDSVQQFIQGIHDFFNANISVGGKTKTRLEVIHEIVMGIAGALKFAYDILSGVRQFIEQIGVQLTPSFDAIIGFFGKLGEEIYKTSEEASDEGTIVGFFKNLATTLKPVTDGINAVVTSVTDLLSVILGLDKDNDDRTKTLDKLGNVLLTIGDIIAKIAGPVLTFISSVINAFTELLKNGVTPESFKELGKNLSGAFTTMMKSFADTLPESFGFLKTWIYDLFGLWEEGTEHESNSFFAFLHKLFTGQFGNLGELLNSFTQGFDLKTALESGFGFISAFNFLSQIIGFFKGTNLYGVIMAFLGVATLFGLYRIVTKAKAAVNMIGEFFDDVGGNLKEVITSGKQGLFGDYEWFSERVANFAKAIFWIAGSIALLGSLKRESLIQGGIAVAATMGAVTLMFFAFSKIKGQHFTQVASASLLTTITTAILALTAGLAVLSLAMIPLASDWKKMAAATAGFVIMLAAIGGFIFLMVKGLRSIADIKTYESNKSKWMKIAELAVMIGLLSTAIMAISASISVLAIALTPLALAGWEGTLSAIVAVGGLLLVIGTFISKMVNIMDELVFKIGGGRGWAGYGKIAVMLGLLSVVMLAISAAISALVVALTPLALTGWQGTLSAVTAVGGILLVFGIFIKSMINTLDELAFRIGGERGGWAGYGKMAISMLALAGSITLLALGVSAIVFAITPLAMMSPEGLAKAVGGLGIILLELGLFTKYITKMTDGKGATAKIVGLTSLAFAIGILCLAIVPLALMPLEAWGRALSGLGIILMELSLFLYLLKKFDLDTAPLLSFTGFAASIAILVLSLIPIANMKPEQLTQALIGLGTVLAEMILVMAVMKKFKLETGPLMQFIGFAAGIGILMVALLPIAQLKPEQMVQGMVALLTVMFSVVILMSIIKEVQPDIKTAGSTLMLLIGLGAAMILFSIAFNEVKNVPWENIIAFAAGISILLLAIGKAAQWADKISFKGILMLAAGLAAIMGVLAAMIPVLVGAIGSSMSDLASRMSIFAQLMSIFTEKMGNVDEGSVDKATNIISKLAGLFGYMIEIKVNEGAIQSYERSISRLTLIADQLLLFQQRIAGVGTTSIDRAKDILGKIGELFKNEVLTISGYYAKASLFSTAMYNLGTGVEIFNNHTQGITDPENNEAIRLIQALSGCAGDLDIIYKMDIDTLTSKLTGLGGAMMIYAQGAKEVAGEGGFDPNDPKAVTNVNAAVELLQAISTTLAEKGGVVIPENMPTPDSLGLFGAQLAALAGALVQFEQAGAGLGDGKDKALETLTFFKDLKEDLERTSFETNLSYTMQAFKNANGEMIQTSELELFGKNIEQLGLSLGAFARSTTYLDQTTGEMKPIDYTLATNALDSIAKLGEKLPSVDGVIDVIFGRRQTIGDLAEEIELLGSSMADLYKQTSTYDEQTKTYTPFNFQNTTEFLDSISRLQTSLPYIGGINLRRIVTGDQMTFDELGDQLTQLGAGLNTMSASITGNNKDGTPKFDATKAAEATNLLTNQVVPALQSMKDGLSKVGGIGAFVGTILHGREQNFEDVSNQLQKLGPGLTAIGKAVSEGGFENADAVTNAMSSLDSIISLMIKLQEFMTNAKDLEADYGYNGFDMFSRLSDLLTFSINGGKDQYGNEIDPIIGKLTTFMDTLDTELSKFAGSMDQIEAMQGRAGIFKTFAEGLNALTGVNTQTDWSLIGQKLVSEVAAAITDGASTVTAAFKGMMVTVYTDGQSIEGADWVQLGKNVAYGVEDGIRQAGPEAVTPAVREMMITAYEAGKQAIDSNSPSKLFMTLGTFAGQGMAIGINKETGEVGKSAGALGEVALDNARDMVALISRIMAEDVNAQPTISPVLDMTNIESGLAQFDASMAGRQTVLDTTLAASAMGTVGGTGGAAVDLSQFKPDYSGVYERMDILGNQIAQLGESIRKIKIVLNTGAVAGGITDDVDINLGRKSFYAGRNN